MTYKNKVETTTKSVEELSNLIVTSNGDKLVRLRDIADIELNKSSDSSRAVANGADSVVLAINPTSSANPLTVAAKVRPLYDSIKIICRMLLNLTSYMTVQLRLITPLMK